MTVYLGFQNQYISLENSMRSRIAFEFPDKDVEMFNSQFVNDRIRADGSGRKNEYTFDERRWLAEKFTWKKFWPDEEFPGKQPPSAAEMLEFNSSQVYQDHAYGGRGGSRGRGRRNMMSPIRGRGYFCGRARESYGGDGRAERQLSFGSFNHHEQPSSLEQEGELVSLHDNTSTSQDQSSLIIDDTPDTQLSDGGRQDFIASTIVCRQCGVTGHPELHCPYQITIKQGLDRERHLVCHTPGHKAFRFNSYHGCLGCKKGSEQRASEKPEPTVVPSINIEDGGTSVAGVHEAACGSGWEETDYNNAIQRSALGSPDELVQVITSGIEAHNLETHTEVKFEKDGKDSRDDGDDEQVLIRF